MHHEFRGHRLSELRGGLLDSIKKAANATRNYGETESAWTTCRARRKTSQTRTQSRRFWSSAWYICRGKEILNEHVRPTAGKVKRNAINFPFPRSRSHQKLTHRYRFCVANPQTGTISLCVTYTRRTRSPVSCTRILRFTLKIFSFSIDSSTRDSRQILIFNEKSRCLHGVCLYDKFSNNNIRNYEISQS